MSDTQSAAKGPEGPKPGRTVSVLSEIMAEFLTRSAALYRDHSTNARDELFALECERMAAQLRGEK